MTQEQAEEVTISIFKALSSLSANETIGLLVGCLCTVLESLPPPSKRQHRDLILHGITSALDGKPIYGK
jgi:hypothetical protein